MYPKIKEPEMFEKFFLEPCKDGGYRLKDAIGFYLGIQGYPTAGAGFTFNSLEHVFAQVPRWAELWEKSIVINNGIIFPYPPDPKSTWQEARAGN